MTTNTSNSMTSKAALLFIATLFTVVTTNALNLETGKNASNSNNSIIPQPTSVVYESLIATATDKLVVVNWKTASEFNNNHFEVEKSTDMKNFKTVAVVLDGFKTEGSGKRYAFKEDAKNVKIGQATYYRLKQFDDYGKVAYSEIIKVEYNNSSN